MSDDFPPRLRTQPNDVGKLLEAVAHEAPSDAHVGVTVAAVLAATSGSAVARTLGAATWVKIAAGIGLAGVVGAIAIHEIYRAPPVPRSSELAPSIVVPREPVVTAPVSSVVIAETPASVETIVAPPPPIVTRQVHPAASDDSSMANEVQRLVAIRQKMLAKDAIGALDGANAYERDSPNGSFVPEAEAMAIEALVDLGRTREAKTRADSFLAKYGNSPQAARIRALTTRF